MVSAQFFPSRTVDQLCNALKKVITLYRRGGYVVRTCLMDMEFEPLVDTIRARRVRASFIWLCLLH